MQLTRPLLFLDCETTGVDPVADRLIELGIVVVKTDWTVTEWCQRFNPGMPIPPASTEIHGITDEMVAGCPPFDSFAAKIAAGMKGKDLCGYGLWRLDIPIIDESLRRCGLRLDLTGVQVIDAFGIFSKKEPRKLEDAVRKYCGREHTGAHGAAADAAATRDVLMGQLSMYGDLAAMDLESLANFSRIGDYKYADLAGKLYYDAENFVCYAFGKNKGTRVIDEPGFAEWCLRQRNPGFPGSTCEVLVEELRKMEGGL